MVGFDLDVTVGSFRLAVAHQAASHRIAILGPSGAGKSITLRALAGLLGPAAGEVRYSGQLVSAVPVEARDLGYVPQGMALFPDRTVWQQLLFAIGADPGLASWWLGTLHLGGLQDRLPDQLSGGQRQRVSLAARSATARGSCCSTSRSPPWTHRSGRNCGVSSGACRTTRACPRYW